MIKEWEALVRYSHSNNAHAIDGKAGAQGQEAIFPKTHSTIVAIIAGSAHRRMPDSNPPEEKQTIMKDSFMMMVFKHWK